MINLYEILVPTQFNNGKPIRVRYHRVWDKKVTEITNGLTILKPTMGKWKSPIGEEFNERMIPVRIACDNNQLNEIIDMTLKYYDQKAIMAYKISNEVIIRYKK